jgi:hypothetical protein
MDDAMEWLRKNDVKPVYLDEPTTMALANAAGLPMPLGRVSRLTRRRRLKTRLIGYGATPTQSRRMWTIMASRTFRYDISRA